MLQAYLPYLQLARLDRPVGSLLLLWPTLAALFIAADGVPDIRLLAVFTLGTFLMRSAGCVINDYADRHVDGAVRRTEHRPMATGAVSEKQALTFFVILSLLSASLLVFLNYDTLLLAIAGMGVAVLYPFMKRFTQLPQVVLGAAFSWGILLAWTATGTGLNNSAGVMFLGSLLWIVAYDTMYAMVDREDDLKAGIKSTAILFGDMDRVMIGMLQGCALFAFHLLAQMEGFKHGFYVGLAVCAILFVYQHRLIRKREPIGCFNAFTNNIWVGFALFCGTLLELLIDQGLALGQS